MRGKQAESKSPTPSDSHDLPVLSNELRDSDVSVSRGRSPVRANSKSVSDSSSIEPSAPKKPRIRTQRKASLPSAARGVGGALPGSVHSDPPPNLPRPSSKASNKSAAGFPVIGVTDDEGLPLIINPTFSPSPIHGEGEAVETLEESGLSAQGSSASGFQEGSHTEEVYISTTILGPSE